MLRKYEVESINKEELQPIKSPVKEEKSQSMQPLVSTEEKPEIKQINDAVIAEDLAEQKTDPSAILEWATKTIINAKKAIDISSNNIDEMFRLIDKSIRSLAHLVSENDEALSELPQNNLTITFALTLTLLSLDEKYCLNIPTFQELGTRRENLQLLHQTRNLLANNKLVEELAKDDLTIKEMLQDYMQIAAEQRRQVVQLVAESLKLRQQYAREEKSSPSSGQLEGPADAQLDKALHELLSASHNDDSAPTQEDRDIFNNRLGARYEQIPKVDLAKNPNHFFSASVKTGLKGILTGAFLLSAYTAGWEIVLLGGMAGFVTGFTVKNVSDLLSDYCQSTRPRPGQ